MIPEFKHTKSCYTKVVLIEAVGLVARLVP